MRNELLKIAIRQTGLLIPNDWKTKNDPFEISSTTSVLVANCIKLGFTFSEELLWEVNKISPKHKVELLEALKEVTGVNKNWTPLIKEWDLQTERSFADYFVTAFANVFNTKKNSELACGHIIPHNVFPLYRFNGCPFCGTPFETEELDYDFNGNELKVLELWTEERLQNYLKSLLESPVALDATQADSLKVLLEYFGLPNTVIIGIKETMVMAVDALVAADKGVMASLLFTSPNDVLRYLWYKHTGFLQLVEPKTIAKRMAANSRNRQFGMGREAEARQQSVKNLKLKFSRSECRMYAGWMNAIKMDIEKQCEVMHPKRGMWVRVIRALRLAEYSKKKGFERLAELLDVFYNEVYEVWQGQYETSRLKSNAEGTFALLKQRPGLFARSLFSNMLWFGAEQTLLHFGVVVDQIPSRLLFTLNMYAEHYFDRKAARIVKPLGGINKNIPNNKLLQLYSDDELKAMQSMIRKMTLEEMRKRYTVENKENQTVYIDQGLYNIPLAIGDRSESVQDMSSALMGTKFPVQGSAVRLFLQWGEGLSAQHLDMDLSCTVAYSNSTEYCSYSRLVIPGCKHSGDIQHIPHMVGTAEYIELDLDTLLKNGAKYVTFTCNAYTNGSLSPNLVVGWMNSAYPMKISRKGVAYNPSDVQHQVRITNTLSKGLVFGVLDVQKREVVWLEMGFAGQLTQNLNLAGTETMLQKLEAKLKVGEVLAMKCMAQGMELIEDQNLADKVYSVEWSRDTAAVSKELLD
ncbi:hypothetical protein V6R21_04470 [Limibacter armeniacum]|uniref:hypothetical protein n=1 Tax=Limibacter armeniacum TaxID=466084 RepID=UPI002FE50AEA